MILEKLHREDSLWEKLKKEKRPIVLYGTGNGADKILDTCEKFGIKVSGVFASGGFVRDRSFRGMKVKSLEDCEKDFSEMTVLLSFGTTLTEVMGNIRKVGEKHTLYIPEVPLYGDELFDFDYYEKNFCEIEKAEKLFCDEESVKVFRDMIAFRLTGEPQYLSSTEEPEASYRTLLGTQKINICIDCGAYRGDSANAIINAVGPEKIYAAEPDPGTFKRLITYAEGEGRCHVVPVNCAVGEKSGEITVMATSGRGSGASGITKGAKAKSVKLSTVDEITGCENIDFIKYDVEGDEESALNGSLETIMRCQPSLAVSVYHRTGDLFRIPLKIREICPEHKLYLRRAPCIPAWDIVLFAIR